MSYYRTDLGEGKCKYFYTNGEDAVLIYYNDGVLGEMHTHDAIMQEVEAASTVLEEEVPEEVIEELEKGRDRFL